MKARGAPFARLSSDTRPAPDEVGSIRKITRDLAERIAARSRSACALMNLESNPIVLVHAQCRDRARTSCAIHDITASGQKSACWRLKIKQIDRRITPPIRTNLVLKTRDASPTPSPARGPVLNRKLPAHCRAFDVAWPS